MDNLVKEIKHALEMGRNRLLWYSITGDEKSMVECKEWNEIAQYNIDRLLQSTGKEV